MKKEDELQSDLDKRTRASAPALESFTDVYVIVQSTNALNRYEVYSVLDTPMLLSY